MIDLSRQNTFDDNLANLSMNQVIVTGKNMHLFNE